MRIILLLSFVSFFVAKVQVCSSSSGIPAKAHAGGLEDKYAIAPLPKIPPGAKAATFAGGCFWCIQPPFDKLKGVIATSVGFTGGLEKNPTYKEVAYGRTSHTEAVYVVYDPKKVSYKKLLDVFWRQINPNQKNGQFADRGTQYRTGIFFHDAQQRKEAEASKKALAATGCFPGKIEVEVTKFEAFYPAENYHQKYYKKNYFHYMRYKIGSGRAGYITRHWKKEGCRRVKQ